MTATPVTLSLGGTYSSTAGANPKLKLWDIGSGPYGLGVSGGSLDYMAPASAGHTFYVNGNATASMMINSSGMVGIGTTGPTVPLHIVNATPNSQIIIRDLTDGTGMALTPYWPTLDFNGYQTGATTYAMEADMSD